MTDNQGHVKSVPPYVTFKGLMNFVDGLKRGIPGQVDRSLMKTMSGSMQNQVLSALKYLQLIDNNGNIKDFLTRLVNSEGTVRTKVLHDILSASYPFLFNGFDLSKATSNQFRQKFIEAGATGDTVRKCIAFFLSAAKEANIEVSPYIAEIVRQQSETKPRKAVQKSAVRNDRTVNRDQGQHEQPIREVASPSWKQMLLAKFPEFDPAWPDEVKKEWFSAFNQMMKMGRSVEVEVASDEELEDVFDDE